MKLPKGYTCPAVAVAFVSSLAYVLGFMTLKANQQDGGLLTINGIYAIFVLATVIWDRMGRFKTTRNSKLVTLGTAVAPIATNIADVLLSLLIKYFDSEWAHAIYFVGVVGVFLAFQMVLCFAIPVKSRKLKKRPHSSTGS